jgi:hypothetical protein
MSSVTIVTGLWDLGRGELKGWAQRDFEEYKKRFFDFLESDIPMCIWIPRELEDEVWKIRSTHNTRVYYKELKEFTTWFPFYTEHEEIRTSAEWKQQAGWLPDSPQGGLPLYNPMMMSKMFMVNDSALFNPFQSDYFYWVDGGLTGTVNKGYFSSGKIFEDVPSVFNKIVHITYPYEANTEIHGFEKSAMYRFCGLPESTTQIQISRGGFWGGPKELIHQYNDLYYQILSSTIKQGYTGADECLFTIAAYTYPNIIERFTVEGNGLVWPFFEAMQKPIELKASRPQTQKMYSQVKTNLYVLGFNAPEQFQSLCDTFANTDFAKKTRKILINNSTNADTFDEYDRLCGQYEFEEIHQNNLGVCGGRYFAAEHFDSSDADYYFFFEDDMNLNLPKTQPPFCKSGFMKYIPNLYEIVHKIMLKENFDFLKLSFSEFYGDNSQQWSWYNLPQNVRTEVWTTYDKLPVQGTDPNSPRTEFSTINILQNVPYITGEIYYSNWPMIMGREGNRKVFLETTWSHPFEQTWMSYVFQKTRDKYIRSAILLASPINHERNIFYLSEERREN